MKWKKTWASTTITKIILDSIWESQDVDFIKILNDNKEKEYKNNKDNSKMPEQNLLV